MAGNLKKGSVQAQALGRSRGGFGTKIHAGVDALGLPVRFMLGPGQQDDMAPACDLIRGLPVKQVPADRAYDADSLCDLIRAQGGEPVIPRGGKSLSVPVLAVGQWTYDHLTEIEAAQAAYDQRRGSS